MRELPSENGQRETTRLAPNRESPFARVPYQNVISMSLLAASLTITKLLPVSIEALTSPQWLSKLDLGTCTLNHLLLPSSSRPLYLHTAENRILLCQCEEFATPKLLTMALASRACGYSIAFTLSHECLRRLGSLCHAAVS